MRQFESPTELEMRDAFHLEPFQFDEPVYYYKFTEENGLELLLSWDYILGSVQTILYLVDQKISTVVVEQGVYLRVRGVHNTDEQKYVIVGRFESAETVTELLIELNPIRVNWSTLEK